MRLSALPARAASFAWEKHRQQRLLLFSKGASKKKAEEMGCISMLFRIGALCMVSQISSS
jgi:hypothetical protein